MEMMPTMAKAMHEVAGEVEDEMARQLTKWLACPNRRKVMFEIEEYVKLSRLLHSTALASICRVVRRYYYHWAHQSASTIKFTQKVEASIRIDHRSNVTTLSDG
jgi:hypothetical protein